MLTADVQRLILESYFDSCLNLVDNLRVDPPQKMKFLSSLSSYVYMVFVDVYTEGDINC